jgi:hypothetical protein
VVTAKAVTRAGHAAKNPVSHGMLSAGLIGESNNGGSVAGVVTNLFRYEEARH